ncbi:MAG TPA: hypothetical protein VH143_06090 [Kofleriaceae bacterium]|nr:hypothetical protein [Kofleriaceae bacterium]
MFVLIIACGACATDRFAAARPEHVPRIGWPAYIVSLEAEPPASDDSQQPNVHPIEAMLRMAALVGDSDPALGHEIRRWLLERVDRFVDARQANAMSPRWLDAEHAWAVWVTASLPALSDDDLKPLAVYEAPLLAPGATFEGLDRVTLGYRFLRKHTSDREPRQWHERSSRDLAVTRDWVRGVFATEPTRRRAIEMLLAGDVDSIQLVIQVMSIDELVGFLHTVEPDEQTWSTVLRAAAPMFTDGASGLVPELTRSWWAYPARRGVLLYMLAAIDSRWRDIDGSPDDHSVAWSHFARTFGAPITRAEFAAMLHQAPDAFLLAPTAWPALSTGWSRTELLLPQIAAALAAPATKSHDRDLRMVLGGIARRACAQHDERDLAQLHEFLARWEAGHHGDPINTVADDYTVAHCRR